MNDWFDKLNLRPHERRLVVIIGAVLFFVLNLVFVWPHFYDLSQTRRRIEDLRSKLERDQNEVSHTALYQAKLNELEKSGTQIASQEQAVQLTRTVTLTAQASGLGVRGSAPTSNRTANADTARDLKAQFFEEQGLRLTFWSDTEQLVHFLVNLANNSSIIRVTDLNIGPDPSQTRLNGTMILIASYQKKPGSASSKTPRPPARARPRGA